MHALTHLSLYCGKVIALGIILGVSIQFAQAWTNPTMEAPSGNVAGPINTGVLTQIKQGSLGLLGNFVANMLQPSRVVVNGAACPVGASNNGLMARDATGVILSCQEGVWRKAAGSLSGVTRQVLKHGVVSVPPTASCAPDEIIVGCLYLISAPYSLMPGGISGKGCSGSGGGDSGITPTTAIATCVR